MVRKFALTSSGPLSGKTTLAKHLEIEYGFIRADHSRSLVKSFVADWNSSLPLLSGPITVEEVYRDKEQWRPLLQEWGYISGFNDPGSAVRWVRYTLSEWAQQRYRDVVFDSLRGEGQASVLREMGFEVVQIEIGEDERLKRAGGLGKTWEDIKRSMAAAPELELGVRHPDIRLNGELTTYQQARILVHLPEGARCYQIFGSQL